MTLANAPKGDEPYVSVTIPLAKDCQASKRFKTIQELRKAFPKLQFVNWEPQGKSEEQPLKDIKKLNVAGFGSEVSRLAMLCKSASPSPR